LYGKNTGFDYMEKEDLSVIDDYRFKQ